MAFMCHIMYSEYYFLPYSRKYWQELNLAVEPQIAIASILVDLKFGSLVRDHHTYIISYNYVSWKFWRILIWRL